YQDQQDSPGCWFTLPAAAMQGYQARSPWLVSSARHGCAVLKAKAGSLFPPCEAVLWCGRGFRLANQKTELRLHALKEKPNGGGSIADRRYYNELSCKWAREVQS